MANNHCVYFLTGYIQTEYGAESLIKVGYTSNFHQRMSDLKSHAEGYGCFVAVDSVAEVRIGGLSIGEAVELEDTIHRLLKPYNIEGEWFGITSELRDGLILCLLGPPGKLEPSQVIREKVKFSHLLEIPR